MHSWLWQENRDTSSMRLRNGSHVRRKPHTGSTYGSYSVEERSIYTTAYILLIPVQERRYFVSGIVNGMPSYKKWDVAVLPTCGYERTGRIIRRGILCYKRTHKRYVSQWRLTSRDTVGVLRISILQTLLVPTTRVVGGGVRESQPVY